ncbi:metal ABC transporter ATP-binding protein [Irregularibacter muris]|uniref:Metal ABC transporter ATP-binding protein n=1 Tax=Irregularibacter muris TaxID=1796619 RepID=A0AAE3HIN8_9FIRM|nr:metal ABC transporter ATP-binding protein [Irregularibacter muris]MCR1900035.1 metal ABC transporter ATP-binding protein [Irregularibacter muris]
MEKIVEVKNITFGYDEQRVLENTSLDIYKGDYMGIIGPNGSAKSTLVKLILGILTPYRGRVKLFQEDIKKFKQWNKVGYISQKATSFNKNFPATVEEIIVSNLPLGNKLLGTKGKKEKEAIDHVLEVVKMQDYKNRLIGNLSGGQQQRVFIARTLASNPELIFLDEPTVGIDVKSQELFYDIMGKLNKEMNMTIVMISHDIGVITEKANRIACMGNRKVHTSQCDSSVEIEKFIKNIYGDKVKMIDHHHDH